MLRDHRPYWLKKAYLRLQDFYVRRYIRPQLASLGRGFTFIKPWHMEFFGGPIHVGRCVHIIATSDNKVRVSLWPEPETSGRIFIGDYCLICSGVRIGAASQITLGRNCMLASNVYITDSDWHDAYNRISAGKSRPVIIKDNVWIGDGAIVCKGVTIGENAIIGAGAVVTSDIPPSSVAAGNPARVVKRLDPDKAIIGRDAWFENPERLFGQIDELDRRMLADNSLAHWIRTKLAPGPGD